MSSDQAQAEPSKTNANINSTIGTIKQTIGDATGYTDLASAGQKQKKEGDAEYQAAQAEGYVEGVSDRVTGKYDNVVGAVTGDKERQISGQAKHDKGQAQQSLNDPSS